MRLRCSAPGSQDSRHFFFWKEFLGSPSSASSAQLIIPTSWFLSACVQPSCPLLCVEVAQPISARFPVLLPGGPRTAFPPASYRRFSAAHATHSPVPEAGDAPTAAVPQRGPATWWACTVPKGRIQSFPVPKRSPAEPRRGARREVRGWPSPCWLDFLSLWGGGGYFCSSMPLFFFFFQKTHEL